MSSSIGLDASCRKDDDDDAPASLRFLAALFSNLGLAVFLWTLSGDVNKQAHCFVFIVDPDNFGTGFVISEFFV